MLGAGRQVFALKLACAGIAGIIGASAVFPLDMVKTRLQNQKVGPNGEKVYEAVHAAHPELAFCRP